MTLWLPKFSLHNVAFSDCVATHKTCGHLDLWHEHSICMSYKHVAHARGLWGGVIDHAHMLSMHTWWVLLLCMSLNDLWACTHGVCCLIVIWWQSHLSTCHCNWLFLLSCFLHDTTGCVQTTKLAAICIQLACTCLNTHT
jgi:hypothetical protein